MALIKGYATSRPPRWPYLVAIIIILFVSYIVFSITIAVQQYVAAERAKKPLIKEILSGGAPSQEVIKTETAPVTVETFKAVKPKAEVSQEVETPIRVEQITFAGKLDEANQPVDNITEVSASASPMIYCLSTISSPVIPQRVKHVWISPSGREVAEIDLTVRRQPATVWSYIYISGAKKGVWEVQVRDANGNILAKNSFTLN